MCSSVYTEGRPSTNTLIVCLSLGQFNCQNLKKKLYVYCLNYDMHANMCLVSYIGRQRFEYIRKWYCSHSLWKCKLKKKKRAKIDAQTKLKFMSILYRCSLFVEGHPHVLFLLYKNHTHIIDTCRFSRWCTFHTVLHVVTCHILKSTKGKPQFWQPGTPIRKNVPWACQQVEFAKALRKSSFLIDTQKLEVQQTILAKKAN